MTTEPTRLTCLYCQKDFEPEDILFFKEDEQGETDELYRQFLSRYHDYPMREADRKGWFFSAGHEGCSISAYEEGTAIPKHLKVKRSLLGGEVDLWDAEETEIFTKRLCPHCHCTLPEIGLGTYEQHRVIVLGDTLSGKTTYLVSLIQKCQDELNKLTSIRCSMVTESKIYYDELRGMCVIGQLEATKPLRLFPIVMSMTPYRDGKNQKPCFVIFYDFAGEGMGYESYIANYPSIERVDTAMVLVDANQYFAAEIDYALKRNAQEGTGNVPEGSFMTKRLDISLEKLSNISPMLNIRTVVGVLNKVDLLMQPGMRLIQEDMEIRKGTLEAHMGGLDGEVIDRLSNQINGLVSKGNHMNMLTSLENAFGRPGDKSITYRVLAVSSYTYSKAEEGQGEGRFIYDPTESGYKHRVLEPLLYLLAQWGIIPVKQSAQTRGGGRVINRWRNGRQ